MHKTQLIEKVSAVSGSSKAETERVLDALSNVITTALVAGDDVSLVNVGKISPITRGARTVNTPMVDSPVQVPERKSAKFSPSSALKRELNR